MNLLQLAVSDTIMALYVDDILLARSSLFDIKILKQDLKKTSQGSINLKPKKSDTFDGKRDVLIVNSRIYQLEQYLALVEFGSPGNVLQDRTRIMYVSTFFSATAKVGWFTKVRRNTIPQTWALFKQCIRAEFVPDDHIRRARDRLRKLKQTTSVSKFLSEFRNVTLTIPDMADGEEWDKFCFGMK